MLKMNLHENWFMNTIGDEKEFPAQVPGSVYNDLLANGQMEDPYYRDNEMKALELMDYDYEYHTVFAVEEAYFQMDEVLLHFDGLDTVADIYLNDNLLGRVANMHRQWDFSVKELLKNEGNVLRIVFHSPTKYIKARYDEDPVEGSEDAMVGFPQIRKPHYMFGWDWGPRTPDAGIWRAVSLLGIEKARLKR